MRSKITFTKKWMNIIMAVSLFDLQLTYVLAFFERQIAETLAVAIVTEIVGVFITYCLKSFFETREEEKVKFMRDKMENEG